MRAYNPIETLAQALYSAVHNNLPPIEYEHKTIEQRRHKLPGVTKTRRPFAEEVKVNHFPQMWSSTALGFGGMGGSAMTEAYTTVVFLEKFASVHFAGRFAYLVEVDTYFINDVHQCKVKGMREADTAYKVLIKFE